ncbi:DNA-binding transcriptional response regulator, NtrC family, contains REC, AAA-type ATPase, and a Fis-type DNA-binding domains [Chryseolinea serpens]|uniref:DNA-binding transcriptional response regulator, NtrC family, contains REC, AAA-type ATPase, and a Fis-type DNA-binding domains n=1 Tax=Chryseolinea serpens TaxID=947013 RepID=A0A1M5SEC1_9BACT|nr:sigma-54 dependent transcriptional regulator [Chryseolinea serpens]SHH36821.1 DNA-binding transcriptional response regulator, NtrC family, contains REC, AAA-type ATPase, and a Fis-type DNA-binding domains [Chryseolinea serpens]
MKASVLVVDDEENLRKLLSRVVELEGYTVTQAASVKEAIKALQHDLFQVVISDVKLPDGNGIDLTARIKKEYPGVEVIVLTAYGTIADGVKAIKNGAFDYLTKGDHQERIIPLLSKAAEKAMLQQKVVALESLLQKKFGFNNILGENKRLTDCIALAEKVAATDTSVLLLGETGTGKEVFAQAIHYESPRKSRSFVALNCSAFPKDLLESELFGHAEGAFTGATKSKKGYVEEAHEGTLFLDEIGEMNIDLQAKLLRVIETGEYYRVGDSKPRKVNTRFIAATNRNLEKESDEGHFRKDLYYRLSVFTIALPSLRDRKDDIGILARFFITQFSIKTNKREPAMSAAFLKALEQHPWKGNIRELKNVIERSVILADDELTESVLPSDFAIDESRDSFELAVAEKHHILKVLRHTQGNKTQAAKLLGIALTTLYQKIKEYSL